MKKEFFTLLFGILIGIISSIVVIFHTKLLGVLRHRFDGLATIISVAVVIILYCIQQRTKKLNAARLIVQEIDAALLVAKKIAKTREYDQTTICIARDSISWSNSIHFFVKNLTQKEIAEVNTIYSRGKYITKCIEEIDKIKKTKYEEVYREALKSTEESEREKLEQFVREKTKDETEKAKFLADAMMEFAGLPAKEITDADKWSGYYKLRQIANKRI